MLHNNWWYYNIIFKITNILNIYNLFVSISTTTYLTTTTLFSFLPFSIITPNSSNDMAVMTFVGRYICCWRLLLLDGDDAVVDVVERRCCTTRFFILLWKSVRGVLLLLLLLDVAFVFEEDSCSRCCCLLLLLLDNVVSKDEWSDSSSRKKILVVDRFLLDCEGVNTSFDLFDDWGGVMDASMNGGRLQEDDEDGCMNAAPLALTAEMTMVLMDRMMLMLNANMIDVDVDVLCCYRFTQMEIMALM